MKKLIALTTLMVCALFSTAYSQSLSKADFERFKKAEHRIADCILIERTYKLLQVDSAKMAADITSKEALIASLTQQVANYKYEYERMERRSQLDGMTITSLEETVKNKSKSKPWGIGPVAGYGLAGNGFGAFIGFALTYGLRF